jgi:hypothetical protein
MMTLAQGRKTSDGKRALAAEPMSELRRALVPALAALCLLPALAGCVAALPSAQKEWEAQAAAAKRHAAEREAARKRAAEVEANLDFELERVSDGHSGCAFATTGGEPVEGIAPVACGDLERTWPLTAPWGFLRCEDVPGSNRRLVVFTTPDGEEYGLSLEARGIGYQSIKPILTSRAAAEGTRRSLAELVAIGAGLCS